MADVTTVELWLPGTPVAAERPRLGRGRRAYTPQRTTDAEWAIAHAAQDAYGCWWDPKTKTGNPLYQDDQALELIVDLSNQGTRIIVRPMSDREPAMRGDFDNYGKTVADGLQKGGVMRNDSRIVSAHIDKWPSWVDPRDVRL